MKHGLVTFTEDGGYYLHVGFLEKFLLISTPVTQNDLAMLELKLVHRLSSLALLNEHFPVSAPDFSKSVVLEVSCSCLLARLSISLICNVPF